MRILSINLHNKFDIISKDLKHFFISIYFVAIQLLFELLNLNSTCIIPVTVL